MIDWDATRIAAAAGAQAIRGSSKAAEVAGPGGQGKAALGPARVEVLLGLDPQGARSWFTRLT